jgi:hypothetical protein
VGRENEDTASCPRSLYQRLVSSQVVARKIGIFQPLRV